MKLIKSAKQESLKDIFTVGAKMVLRVDEFDGRYDTSNYKDVTIVKINRKTVDVETAKGNVYRINNPINDLLLARPTKAEYTFDGRN